LSNYCVIDARIIGYANRSAGKHISKDQKARWGLLQAIWNRKAMLVKNDQLLHEYLPLLKSGLHNDYVKNFVRSIDSDRAVKNEKPLLRHELAKSRSCRFPKHDEHLLKAANGLDNCVIVAEEEAHLRVASCMKRELGFKIQSPRDVLDDWGLQT